MVPGIFLRSSLRCLWFNDEHVPPLPLSKSSQGGKMTALGTRSLLFWEHFFWRAPGIAIFAKCPPDRQGNLHCSDLLLIASPSIVENFCQYDPNTWENSQIISLSLRSNQIWLDKGMHWTATTGDINLKLVLNKLNFSKRTIWHVLGCWSSLQRWIRKGSWMLGGEGPHCWGIILRQIGLKGPDGGWKKRKT